MVLLCAPTVLALVVSAAPSATLSNGTYDHGSYGDDLRTPNGSTLDCSYDGMANVCRVWGGGATAAHDTVDWASGAFDAKVDVEGKISDPAGTPWWQIGTGHWSPVAKMEVNAGDDDWFADHYMAQARFVYWMWGSVDRGNGYEIGVDNKEAEGAYLWSQSVGGSTQKFRGYRWKAGAHNHIMTSSGSAAWVQSDKLSLSFESICRIRLLSADDTERTFGIVSSDKWSLYVAAWDNGGVTLIDDWTVE